VPAVLLALVLGGLLGLDIAQRVSRGPGEPVEFSEDTTSFLPLSKAEDPDARLAVEFTDQSPTAPMRFGIQMTREQDPENPDKRKRLTYQERGDSNNTCLLVDGQDSLFGEGRGAWVRLPADLSDEKLLRALLGPRSADWLRENKRRPLNKVLLSAGRRGRLSVWQLPEHVRVYQSVELVVGEQTLLIDTVLVHYTMENRSTAPHRAGLRVMLDTFIGGNDGVPFTIPGQPGLLDTMKDFTGTEIPDYIQALERPDPHDPGTVAHMGLKGFQIPGAQLDPIDKLRICHWPGSFARWEWEPKPIADVAENGKKDSAVALYWNERELQPGERRDMAFTYGLNRIAKSGPAGSRLGLTAGGRFRPGGEFTLTAYIKNPEDGQRVKLEDLPDGLRLLEGQDPEQVVRKGGEYSQVSWRIRAEKVGGFQVEATSGAARATYTVRIREANLFRGK
jgi:hypothetical protein